jgi:hypothetical protein
MDSAKLNSCEQAAALVESYGGVSASVVIELSDMTEEAFTSFPGVEQEAVSWGVSGMRTRMKHADLGSGVIVNGFYLEDSNR